MGLDIRSYSNIHILGVGDEYDEELESSDLHQDFINPSFPHAVPAALHRSHYLRYITTAQTESHGFRAGSYSGYGMWRGMLSEYALDLNSFRNDDFWQHMDSFVDKPFYKLINFSDCEGIFYGPVCAELRDQFIEHRDGFKTFAEGQAETYWDHYTGVYDDFLDAFTLAANDGVVVFC